MVHALANAELYCLALAHIYADPNYSQLNHWGVIQALARKGVYLQEPADVALTETTLIHTSPLRMVLANPIPSLSVSFSLFQSLSVSFSLFQSLSVSFSLFQSVSLPPPPRGAANHLTLSLPIFHHF